jgi:hypothetical protein
VNPINFRSAKLPLTPEDTVPTGPKPAGRHRSVGAHTTCAPGASFRSTIDVLTPTIGVSTGTKHAGRQVHADPHPEGAPGVQLSTLDFWPTIPVLAPRVPVSAGPILVECPGNLVAQRPAALDDQRPRPAIVPMITTGLPPVGPILAGRYWRGATHGTGAPGIQLRPTHEAVMPDRLLSADQLAGRQQIRDPHVVSAPGIQLSNVDSRPTSAHAMPKRSLSAEPNPAVRQSSCEPQRTNACGGPNPRPTGRNLVPNRTLSAEPNPVACLIPVDASEADAGDGPTSGGPR